MCLLEGRHRYESRGSQQVHHCRCIRKPITVMTIFGPEQFKPSDFEVCDIGGNSIGVTSKMPFEIEIEENTRSRGMEQLENGDGGELVIDDDTGDVEATIGKRRQVIGILVRSPLSSTTFSHFFGNRFYNWG